MSLISKPIIPIQQTFYDTESNKISPWKNVPKNYLDFRAISCFCSLGFMLDDDTFSNKIKVLKPATDFQLNEDKEIIQEKKNWNWHYKPQERTFNDILEEFIYPLYSYFYTEYQKYNKKYEKTKREIHESFKKTISYVALFLFLYLLKDFIFLLISKFDKLLHNII